jgi:hypothetical protein
MLEVLPSVCARLAPAAIPSGVSSAAYTLLGVAITGFVTLLAVVIKYAFDTRAEARRYRHELEIQNLEHARELDKLQMQLHETRTDALRDLQRRVFATYLAETHAVYLDVVDARRQRRQNSDDQAYLIALKSIAPGKGQLALEECRLVVLHESARHADGLWDHLRSHPVPKGVDLGSREWGAWKDAYWELRRAAITHWQADLTTIHSPNPSRCDVV